MLFTLNRPFKVDRLLREVIDLIYRNYESSRTYNSNRNAEYGRTNLTLELFKEFKIYFLFLMCEVNCGATAIDIADRQNAHSMTFKCMRYRKANR